MKLKGEKVKKKKKKAFKLGVEKMKRGRERSSIKQDQHQPKKVTEKSKSKRGEVTKVLYLN